MREARALGDIIGQNRHPSGSCCGQIEMVAPTDATVLILGESGTGKELVAREVHRRSRRAEHPLIRVNCASVPRELYESEFFGHVKGAFTGAIKDRAGRFEAADGGTLFLDEVGEIPLDLQSKFLRVLQEKQYERVGEESTRTVDVRIIAASNRDLKKEVEEGRFRQDLYYRLNVFPIEVPPLRERRTTSRCSAAHFLEQTGRTAAAAAACPPDRHPGRVGWSYDLPGTRRELQNALERALILAKKGVLEFDLPVRGLPEAAPPPSAPVHDANGHVLTEAEIRDLEKRNAAAALAKARWKIHGPCGAAQSLGLKPTTLISRIKKLGLRRPAG